MDLQSTLQRTVLQLKDQPRTLRKVTGVFQKIIKTLYDANFRNAEAHRPGPIPACPDSDILTMSWLPEYIGADTVLFPTLRSNQKAQYTQSFRKLQVRLCRRIETTIAQLTEQFCIPRIRALAHWGM